MPVSTYRQFPYEYALHIKQHYPDIWSAGGNILGNQAFKWWSAYRRGVRSDEVMYWFEVLRPAWISRHHRNYKIAGVIAQMKWGSIGDQGVGYMKSVVEEAIDKYYAN